MPAFTTSCRYIVWLFIFISGLVIWAPAQATGGLSGEVPGPGYSRIISLAPSITEILFHIRAGDKLVGTVEYSDFPEAALSVPRIGSYQSFDLEKIVSLQPDLVIAWKSGNNPAQLAMLKQLGLRVIRIEPRNLSDLPVIFKQLGDLLKLDVSDRLVQWQQKLQDLQKQYSNLTPVRVLYQIWHQPLMTVNGEHIISDVIHLCGGVNVFADSQHLVTQLSVESVLASQPDVILSGDTAKNSLDEWQKWPQLNAVKQGHLYQLPADLLHRPGPRLLDGAEIMCRVLDKFRP